MDTSRIIRYVSQLATKKQESMKGKPTVSWFEIIWRITDKHDSRHFAKHSSSKVTDFLQPLKTVRFSGQIMSAENIFTGVYYFWMQVLNHFHQS